MSFGRILFGILLFSLGGLTIAFGVFIFVQNSGWQSGWFAVGSLLFGATLLAEGWAIFQGVRIRDVIDEIISSLMWY
jgi:hypothetical protein